MESVPVGRTRDILTGAFIALLSLTAAAVFSPPAAAASLTEQLAAQLKAPSHTAIARLSSSFTDSVLTTSAVRVLARAGLDRLGRDDSRNGRRDRDDLLLRQLSGRPGACAEVGRLHDEPRARLGAVHGHHQPRAASPRFSATAASRRSPATAPTASRSSRRRMPSTRRRPPRACSRTSTATTSPRAGSIRPSSPSTTGRSAGRRTRTSARRRTPASSIPAPRTTGTTC